MSAVRHPLAARVRGLYAIADADASHGDPEGMAADLFAGGCRLLQVRCKGWPIDDVERVTRAVVARGRRVDALVIVNDHAELVAATGAHGVHVGQQDAAPELARALAGAGALLGVSTNDPTQAAAAAQHADYVAFGPVWPTRSAGRPKRVRDLDTLRAVRAAISAHTPLVAIGGVDVERVPLLRGAGADAWAVIAAIAGAADRVAATRALCLT
jgi:thiamine-phosphate pyrophosphorylase